MYSIRRHGRHISIAPSGNFLEVFNIIPLETQFLHKFLKSLLNRLFSGVTTSLLNKWCSGVTKKLRKTKLQMLKVWVWSTADDVAEEFKELIQQL